MPGPNVAASIAQRLLNASRALGISHELLVRRYVFERLLWRLQHSPHAGELCLKGAMSFLAVTGDLRRPTKDMDFLGRDGMAPGDALAMFREIALVQPDEDDGLRFDADGFAGEAIKEHHEQPGSRIHGIAWLGHSRVRLKLEVAYGDVLTPGAVMMDYPTVLANTPPPRILVISKETMLAEKFEAVCSLGERNTRFKDFYDIRGLARATTLDGGVAAEALSRTFANRGTPLPTEMPVAFLPGFEGAGQRGWAAFKLKQGLKDAQPFPELVAEIAPLVMGLAARALSGDAQGSWSPGKGWTEARDQEERAVLPF